MKRKINLIVAVLLVVAICATMVPVNSEALTYSGSSSYMSGKYYKRLTGVTLTGNQRTDIVNIAKSQIGYQEGGSSGQFSGEVAGSNNYTEYGRWFGSYIGESWYSGAQWCAMFVSWCAKVAGISSSIIQYDQYTETQVKPFKNAGRAYTWSQVKAGKYTPIPGDIVYFLSSSGAASGRTVNHVGIVTDYKGGTLYTIEGNTSSAYFSTDGGCCSDKTYASSSTYVAYICSPNYTTGTSLGGLYNENDFIPSNVQSAVFDPYYYAATSADVIPGFGSTDEGLFDHFVNHGAAEGRQGSPIFDVREYIENNADLRAAFGKGAPTADHFIAAIKHFGTNGAFSDSSNRYTATPDNLGKEFKARFKLINASLNFSLSETNVIAYTPSEAAAQIWHFTRQDDGSYKIVNTKNNYVLSVANNSKLTGADVQIAEDTGAAGQRWYVYKTYKKDGSDRGYVFKSVVSPACVLTVASSSPVAMDNVYNATYAYNDSQIFNLQIVEMIDDGLTPEPEPEPEPEPTPSTELKIDAKLLTLYSDITVKYVVKKAEFDAAGYTNPKLVVLLGGKETTINGVIDTVSGIECYAFSFNNVAPQMMNDTIEAKLYADWNGKEYSSETVEYSVATYIYSMLGSTTNAEFRTMLVDMLRYGSAAQVYTKYNTSNLVDSKLTAEQAAWGTASVRNLSTVKNIPSATASDSAKWVGMSLYLDSKVAIRGYFDVPSKDGVYVEVADENGNVYDKITAEDFTEVTGPENTPVVSFIYDGLNFAQMSKTVKLTVCDSAGNKLSGTAVYSIESYVYSTQSSTVSGLADLVKAMIVFGDASNAYAN